MRSPSVKDPIRRHPVPSSGRQLRCVLLLRGLLRPCDRVLPKFARKIHLNVEIELVRLKMRNSPSGPHSLEPLSEMQLGGDKRYEAQREMADRLAVRGDSPLFVGALHSSAGTAPSIWPDVIYDGHSRSAGGMAPAKSYGLLNLLIS